MAERSNCLPILGKETDEGLHNGPFQCKHKETNVSDQSAYHNQGPVIYYERGTEEIFKKVTSYYNPALDFIL